MEPETILKPRTGSPILLVGTMKGAFVLGSDANRSRWEVSGPFFPGSTVYAMAYDSREGRSRLWASSSNFFGTALQSTDDFGKTWSNPESAPIKFPDSAGQSLKQIWQITPGREAEPGTLYCGVEPSALFRSTDGGETWSLVEGLHDHPHRAQWQPGGGGMCLHTISPDPADPKKLLVAVSTGGVYRTDDGGASWQSRNSGISAEFLPEKYPEFGQCVHKVDRPSTRPERLYLQNHGGLFRSDDGGDSWSDIANDVPSDFGFAVVAHPHDADTAYVFPLEREMRCGPDRKMRVYRTRNAGASWEPLASGMPGGGVFETVLRDGMAADRLDPAGIYFGTRSGKLYGSRDEGARWEQILDGLPAITCVKAALA